MNLSYAYDNKTLDKLSVDITDVELLSNIGEIGMAPDYSQNQLANDFQNEYPVIQWLLNTQASRMAQSAFNAGRTPLGRDENNNLTITLPYTVGTTVPEDTQGECCWTPLNLQKCGKNAPLHLLCLKDCEKILENFVFKKKRFGSNDLTNTFQRPGETVKQARERMARLSMAFFSANNILNGTTTTGTPVLKPFHGVIEIMEGADVIKVLGTNILAAFDSVACRLAVLGANASDIVFALHPLVYQGIESVVVPSKFNGELPQGWTKVNGELHFKGHRFIQDKHMPFDLEEGTGDIWMLDSRTTGVVLGTDLMVGRDFIREQFAPTDDPKDGCATECTFYYNFGTAFNTNSNRLAVITDVPTSANCIGESLDGLDSIINPQTIVPIDVKA